MTDEDAPLMLPRAAVENLHQLLGRLLGDEGRAQSSTVEGDGICTATLKDPEGQVIRCAQPAGHYDGDNQPDPLTDDSPGGWHRSAPGRDRVTWADWATGTTPHKETP